MATKLDGLERVEVASQAEWRAWLKRNHARTEGIWLVSYKKHVAEKHLPWDTIVEEALCFGWIDSTARALDADRRMLYLRPRKAKGVWSRINKARVEELIRQKRMAAPGMRAIELAKANGSWNAIDHVEALTMPEDLNAALARNATARRHFEAFPPGSRKIILHWISNAKAPATRSTRIRETVALAAKNIRANHYQRPPKTTMR